MDNTTLHRLVECKMAISPDQEEAPPRVPAKEPDAPPSYQPAETATASTASSHSHVHQVSPTAPATYTHPSPSRNGQSSTNEICIPFYSNPPPAPDLPDHKAPILADVRRPSKETDRMPPFACLTLHSNDKLGSTNLSAEITNDLDRVIRAKWTKGVKQWAHEDGGWCWQLQGKPCKRALHLTSSIL